MANGLIDFGIIKPELANAFATGYQQAEDRRVAAMQEAQKNQLANLQLEAAMQESADRNALRNASSADVLANPMRYGKSGLDYAKTIRDAQTAKLNQMKTTVDLMKNTATSIMANPASARDQVVNFGRLTGTDVTGDLAQLDAMGGDLEKIKQWAAGHALEADKLLPKFQQFDQGGAVVTGTVDPLTGKFVQGTAFQKSMAPGEAQRIGLEARRVAVLEENQRRDADPAFQQRMAGAKAVGEAIAKGDVAAQQALPQIIGRAEEGMHLIDELIGKRNNKGQLIEGSKPHPGFENAVGATWLPGSRFVPGTDAAGFMARFDQIKGASFLEAFQALKGGGAITEKEGAKGTDAINRMSTSTDEKEFIRAALDLQDVIRKGVENAQKRAARAGGAAPAVPAAPAAGGVKFLGFE